MMTSPDYLPLPFADFVPNLSVHRLIHIWSLSLSSPTSISPRHRICVLMNRISAASAAAPVNFKELSYQLLNVLRLARDSEENREALANSERFACSIVELISKPGGENEFLELAVMVLELALRGSSRSKEKIQKQFSKSDFNRVVSLLRGGKTEVKIAAARVLEAIAINNESKIEGLINNLYCLVTSNDRESIEAGLSTLISLSTTKSLKSELVQSGIVRALSNSLTGTDHTNTTIMKAMEMAELLATCSAGRLAICEDDRLVAEILKRLLKVSEKATEHGITVLWSVCYLFWNNKAVDIAARSNGMAKCLLVLQSKCSMVVKQMCRDLVKVLRVESARTGLMSFDTKTTHIMTFSDDFNLEFCKSLHSLILKLGFTRQLFVSSGMVTVYSKCDRIEDARKVFDETPQRNVVVWNSMIFASAQKGLNEEAVELFSGLIWGVGGWKRFVNEAFCR